VASNQDFIKIVGEDRHILERENVTREELGDSLESVLNGYDHAKGGRQQISGSIYIEEARNIRTLTALSEDMVCAFLEYSIGGLPNGNRVKKLASQHTLVSPLLPDLIRRHGFFGGRMKYGLRPEWVIDVHHKVQEKGIYSVQPEMVYHTGSHTRERNTDFHGSAQIKDNPDFAMTSSFAEVKSPPAS